MVFISKIAEKAELGYFGIEELTLPYCKKEQAQNK
jgi:hypothetical protein